MRIRGLFCISSVRMMFTVALAAMVVRAMVPVGWMIAADPETGRIGLELCSGRMAVPAPVKSEAAQNAHDHNHDHGMMHGAVDPHAGHDVPAQDGPHDHEFAEPACPFALASVIGQTGAPVILQQPVQFASIDHELPPLRGPPALRVASAPLPARGPPSSI